MSEFSRIAVLMAFVITVVPLLLTGVVHVAVTRSAPWPSGPTAAPELRRDGRPAIRASVSRDPHDGDRAARAVYDRVADRAEEHALVGASPARSHHH